MSFMRLPYWMDGIMRILNIVRAHVVRFIKPRASYMRTRSQNPISVKYGFDRGKPVDRLFIERFLEENKRAIRGKCLEVVDNSYTVRFGGTRVTTSDVIDIFPTAKANIHGDLRNLRESIADNEYDCLIVTQTFNVIDDYGAAIAECRRILKPGGTLLVTMPTVSPAWNLAINLWRFTPESSRYVFEKFFDPKKITISAFGNKPLAEAFWLGMAVEDMATEEITRKDESFPVIVGIQAVK